MKDSKEFRLKVMQGITDNKVVNTIKENPVTTGVTATFIAGSTIAYTAAGVSVKTAFAYSCGVAMVYGAMIYGGYKAINYLAKEQK